MGKFLANAQIKLPIRKAKLASRSIGFRPQMSLSLPQSGTNAALVRENDEAIHEYPLSEALKSAAIVGRAVDIIVCRDPSALELVNFALSVSSYHIQRREE
jgi:hypothetical protein